MGNTSFKNIEKNPIEVDGLILGDVEIKQMPLQADSTADNVGDLVADFNDLLAKLKAAGLMASS